MSPSRPIITDLGPVARRTLTDGRRGQVCAVFERSFYLRAGDDFVCIGGAGIGCGPLNAVVASAGPMPQAGDPFAVDGEQLTLGADATLSLHFARIWRPATPIIAPPEPRQAALATVIALAGPRAPADGLARLVLAPCTAAATPVARIARPLIEDLRGPVDGWPFTAGIRGLIGLGPGLTPSGDDLIGGLLIAFAALGQLDTRDRVWRAVAPALALGTSPLSAAHLRAAAEGFGAAAVHDLLADLLSGRADRLADHLDAIDGIGHCSGWDALAGIVVALR